MDNVFSISPAEFSAEVESGNTFEIYDNPPVPVAWVGGDAPDLDGTDKILVFSGTAAGWVADGGVYG